MSKENSSPSKKSLVDSCVEDLRKLNFTENMSFVNFHIGMVAGKKKSELVKGVLSINKIGSNDVYLLPDDAIDVRKHGELMKNKSVKSMTAALKKKGQFRNVMVELTETLKDIYLDAVGNVIFEDYHLQLKDAVDRSILDEKIDTEEEVEQTYEHKNRSLQSITKDIVIPKYSGKTQNAEVWLRSFNAECNRLAIPENRRAEAMRLFLEKTPLDWFNGQWSLRSLDSWKDWSENFLESFADKGWHEITYALDYKYLSGSVSDYVIKKYCLLVDALPDMNEKMRTAVVVAGMPIELSSKIDRSFVDSQGKLLSEITKWEIKAGRERKNNSSKVYDNENEKGRRDEKNGYSNGRRKKACSWCEKRGFRGKYHPESICWNNPSHPDYREKLVRKNFSSNNNNNEGIKLSNSTELEQLISESVNSKN